MPAETFREFEHAGWQLVADTYQKHFGSLTSQTIEPILDAVDAGPSKGLLDIAAGPGYVAAAAARRGANVLGLDFSAVMVAMAQQKLPQLKFVEGNAEKLALPDQSFDAATMNFGMLHLEDAEAAMSEAHRVLKPAGKFAWSVWGTADEAMGFKLVLEAIKHCGDPAVPMPQGPPFFRFSDPAESRKAMQNAGFTEINTLKISMSWELASTEDFFNAFYYGTPRTGGILRLQSEEQLRAIRQAINESLESYKTSSGGVLVPMLALVVSGRKPA